MKKIKLWQVLHMIYLGVLLTFIYFYFSAIQPIKTHQLCAKSASEEVLKAKPEDAVGLYKKLYQACSTKSNLLTFSF